MEIKVSEVMQREDNSLYLKEIEVINYEKVEILNTPDNVVKLMTDVFEINKKISEEIFVIALTTNSKPLHFFRLNRGTVNNSLFDTRGLMISLLLANASTFVIVHNHPSGSITPSKPEIDITQKLNKAAELLGLTFTDHIIVGKREDHYSLREFYDDIAKVRKKVERRFMFEIKGKVNTAICYAKVFEQEAVEQIRRMCDYELTENSHIRIMPDVH